MLVECTYQNKDKCRYTERGSFEGFEWKAGDICKHAPPHEKHYTCNDIGNCGCRQTFKCQMLEAIRNEKD